MPIQSRGFRNVSKLNSSIEDNGGGWRPFDRLGGLGESRATLEFTRLGADDAGIVGSLTPNLDGEAIGGDETGRAPTGPGLVSVPTTLTPGAAGIAIIGVNTEDTIPGGGTADDRITFILLSAIGSGTVIFFTDRSWNGTAFAAAGGGEGTFTFTAGADLAAGTVITITQAQLTTAGMALSDLGETIYAYQGAINAPTAFLHAVELGDGNTAFNANLTNTGLVAGTSALALAVDNAEMGSRSHNINAIEYFRQVNNNTDWVQNDNSPQDGTQHSSGPGTNFAHAHVAPDSMLLVAGSGAGEAIVTISLDGTYNAGTIGYQIVHAFQNAANLFHPSDITLDTVNDKYFFVDADLNGNNRIIQGSISELLNNPGQVPTYTVLYTNTGTGAVNSMRTISIDTVNQKIYFDLEQAFVRINYDTAAQTPTVLRDLEPIFGPDSYITQMTINYATGTVFLGSSSVTSVFGSDAVFANRVFTATGLTGSNAANSMTFTAINWGANGDTAIGGEGAPLGNDHWPVERGTIRGVDVDPISGLLWIVTGTVILDNDSNGLTTYRGGVWTYNPSTGVVTNVYTQNGVSGPVGLLYYIEVDSVTGRYYVVDESGANGVAGDGGVWSGSITGPFPATPTLVATVGNFNGLGPQGLEIQHAPTLTGSGIAGLAVTEASSAPNSGETARLTVFTGLTADDVDTLGGDELRGAVVRISGNFVFEASSTATGHAATVDFLRINNLTSGTISGSGITFAYDQTTGMMVLSGVATTAEYAAAIALVQFSTSGDNVTGDGNALTRTISASVFDGLLYSDEITNSVTVTGINDAPRNTIPAAPSFTEDTTGTAGIPVPPPAPVNAIVGLAIADADADATTEIFTVTLNVQNGVLNIRTDVVGGLAAGNVTGNGTATLVLTGTQTQINTTLAATNNVAAANGLVYTPAVNYNGADTLTMTTNDAGNNGNDPGNSGTGTTEQDSDTLALNIADVNDAPSVGGDGTEDSPVILEDTPFTNLNAPTVATLFGGQFSDALDVQVSGGNPTGSPGDTLAGIAVVANGSDANGNWQYWDGDSWENIGAVTIDAARTYTAATLIRFNPTLNFNGAAPTLTVRLIESSASAVVNNAIVDLNPAPPITGPTAIYTSGSVTLSQAITPVNDAPTSTLLLNDTAIHLETATVTQLDLGGNATIADVDSANFDGGSLTVALSGSLAEDQLVISAIGGVTSTATTVSVSGTQIATYTGGANGAPLVFTFDADATPAAVQSLVRAIGYSNSAGDNPTDGDRTVTWTLVDGDGTLNGGVDTLVITSTLDVDPINDPPAGIDGSVLINEDAVHTFTAANFAFTDAENHALSQVRITTLPGNGVITLNNVAITAGADINVADINAGNLKYTPDANENGTPHDSFTFQVRDAGGTLDGGVNLDASANTFTFNVTAVNDAPVHTVPLATQTFNEDTSRTFNAANSNLITIADVDAGAADVQTTLAIQTGTLTLNAGALGALTSVTGDGTNTVVLTGTVAEINAALNGLVYNPGANYNGGRTLTVTTNDLGNTGADPGLTGTLTSEQDSDNISVQVTSVNDAPTVIGDGTEEAADIIEDTPGPGQSVFDLFNGQYSDAADAQFSVSNPGGSSSGSFGGVAVVANGSSLATGQWQYFNTDTSAWVDIGARTTATALLIGSGTLVRFNPALDFTGAAPTLTVHLIDNSLGFGITFGQVADISGVGATGGSTPYSTGTVVLSQNVIAANIAPVVDLDANDSSGATGGDYTAAGYTENGAAVAIADADVTITDADAGDMVEGATINVSDAVAGDGLTLSAALPAGITVLSGLGTSTLVLTGTASAADYQTALTLVRYSSSSEDPTVGGTDAQRTVTVTVTDGSDNSVARTATVSITGANDAPAGTDATITAVEDTHRVLSSADFGFTDPDSGDAFSAVTITGVTGGGKLFYDADGTAGGGAPVEVTAFPNTYSAAELAAGNVSYLANLNVNGTGVGTITFQVIDNSGAVNNTDTSPNTLTVNVTPINDQPNIPNSPTVTTDEQVAVTLNAAITVSDVDLDARNGGNGDYSGAAFAINRSVSNAEDVFSFNTAGAQFTVNGSNLESGGNVIATLAQSGGILNINFVNNGTVPTTALVNDVLQHLQYTNTSNEPPASVTLIYIIDDGAPANGGQGALGAPFNNLDGGQVIVNINLINDAPAGADKTITIDEDVGQVLTTADFGFTDTDNDAFDSAVVVTVTGGTILVDDGNIATPPVSLTSGTISAADIAAGYVSFQPTAHLNGSGAGAINFQVVDNGGTANGGQNTDQSANTITFNIDSVNDAPSGANNTVTGSEDDPYVFALADFGFNDTADGDDFAGVIFTTVPTTGTLFYDADGPGGAAPVALADGAGPIAAADIAAGRVYFVPVADAFGSPYASFTFQVQDDGGIANGGVDLDPTPNTMTINVTPDNLPPVVDLNGPAPGIDGSTMYIENFPGTPIAIIITVTDPDSGLGDLIEGATITLTDRVAGDVLAIAGALPAGITANIVANAGSIVVTLSGSASQADYATAIGQLRYSSTSDDPTVGGTDAQRTITVTVTDGAAVSAVATSTVTIVAQDDAPVAQNDAFTTDEAAVLTGNLFADNGSGADSDPDSPLVIGAVNGSAAAVGNQITLASGALLTVNANGTFSYDPNGAFDPTPTPGSGASNQPASDGFTYTLQGGNTATVALTINGLDTDDLLLGTAGSDMLFAGVGADTLVGGLSNDFMDGGAGIDTATFAGALTSFADSAIGWVVTSADGNDVLQNVEIAVEGSGQRHLLVGSTGFATIQAAFAAAGAGDNVRLASGSYIGTSVYDDAGLTVIAQPNAQLNVTFAPSGTAGIAVYGANPADVIATGAGDDVLSGGGGADILAGGGGNDIYIVDSSSDVVIEAAAGGINDAIYTSASYVLASNQEIETLATLDWNSTAALDLTGNGIANYLIGNAGANVLNGGGGADAMHGLGGSDTYIVNNAGDQVVEASGGGVNDGIYTSSSYTLGDGQEIETLSALDWNSTAALNLTGNEIGNYLIGNAGANLLDGKGGNDVLVGQGGADTFAFTTAAAAGNADQIGDFLSGTDKLGLDDAVFAGIGTAGSFNANAFRAGTSAQDADDRIVYNQATGQLFYDADGNGAGAQVLFATLNNTPILTASDFQVI